MHTHWHFLPHMLGVSLLGGLLFLLVVRGATRRLYRWQDIRTPVLWISSALALFGVLFFVGLKLH